MKTETIHNVACKLVGDVRPIGDQAVDSERLDNLLQLIRLTDLLLEDIAVVAESINSPMGSISKAGKVAQEFLNELAVR